MKRSMMPMSWRPLMVALLLAWQPASAGEPLKRTSVERMNFARLEATHRDAEKIRAQRRTLAPREGLIDFRTIFHAHAEDSAHTGGTRPEMLAEAKKAGVQAIFLSDHFRPPRDFITESWRGLRDGVLFVPGSETHGFLILPSKSVMTKMDAPRPEFLKAINEDGGMAFLSHVEERVNHSMEGLTGQEIYNRHYDAKVDKAGLFSLILKLTDPASLSELKRSLEAYPDELFAFHVERPTIYLKKWDDETKSRRLTGVAANDCHHNQVLLVKMVDAETVLVGTNVDKDDQMQRVSAKLRPGIREMTKGHKPGDVLVKVDLDPYARSFLNVSTHLIAKELTEEALRDALRSGSAYVSHDWICDPTGFRFDYHPEAGKAVAMGGEMPIGQGGKLAIKLPAPGQIRLIRGGQEFARGPAGAMDFEAQVKEPGVYRVEVWVTLDGEERPWIYSNPIYLR